MMAVAVPAQAMVFGGGSLSHNRDGNTINSVEVTNLEVLQGTVQAASAFVLNSGGDDNLVLVHTEAVFTGLGDGAVTVTNQDLLTDVADLKNGGRGKAAISGSIQIPADDGAKIKAALDGGTTLTISVTVHLVLVDAARGDHILGTASLTETVAPAP